MAYWFKFKIPKQPTFCQLKAPVISSPSGWFGEMAKCPTGVTVLLYNEPEGYGCATSTDTFVPPEVEVITKAQYDALLVTAKAKEAAIKLIPEKDRELTADGKYVDVYYGTKLADKDKPKEVK